MPIIPITLITLIYNKIACPCGEQAILFAGIDKVNAKHPLRVQNYKKNGK